MPADPDPATPLDVVVVGGGQSALAVGHHLHRHDRDTDRHGRRPLRWLLLDSAEEPGGAWPQAWRSLRLFSPAAYSSLPGRPMPAADGDGNPSADHVADYLRAYERRYDLAVQRPVRVVSVRPAHDGLLEVRTRGGDDRTLLTRHVVNATGTWDRPFVPAVAGVADFTGTQEHVVAHTGPGAYDGRRVMVVGGGNSGAQVTADLLLARAAGEPAPRTVHWVTRRSPRYLPDEVDGRVLFETATRAAQDLAAGRAGRGVGSLGDVVATPPVRRARDDLGMTARVGLARLTRRGARFRDGADVGLDTVVWATGFRPALGHLRDLGVDTDGGRPVTTAAGGPDAAGTATTRSTSHPGVWFVGYGDWCGGASATLIGVGRAARDTVAGVVSSAE